MLSIKFNGDDVPNSPFRIPVTSSSGQTDSTHSVNEDDVCQVRCGLDTSCFYVWMFFFLCVDVLLSMCGCSSFYVWMFFFLCVDVPLSICLYIYL